MQDIYAIAEKQKQALLARERRASVELVSAYGRVYQRIQARVAALTAQIEEARGKGEIVSSSFLYERDRLSNLQIDIEREMRRFSVFATARVTSEQRVAVEAAATDAQRLVGASLERSGASVGLQLARLSSSAVERMVGFSGDGSPLRTLFERIAPQMAKRITTELVSGVAEGAGVRVIAARIRERSGVGLARALLISRNEVTRAYREVSHSTFHASGDVLEGWHWSCSLSGRTCAMCIAMHGRIFPLSQKLRSHPGCRCVPVPLTKGSEPPKSGEEWLREQEAGVQREILGDGKYAAFRDGKFQLEDLVGVRHDPQWGTTRYERSLKDMLA
ncbi:MAG: phage minor head protein [Pyrinomonadaceae bacterium]